LKDLKDTLTSAAILLISERENMVQSSTLASNLHRQQYLKEQKAIKRKAEEYEEQKATGSAFN
jgi:hypothetical protein